MGSNAKIQLTERSRHNSALSSHSYSMHSSYYGSGNQNRSNNNVSKVVPQKGAVLFTGPDGLRDHRVNVDDEHRYVGEGWMSSEGTSEVDYLWRAPNGTPHPRSKSGFVGEIGWGVPRYMYRTSRYINTGAQITLGEFRQAVEDRYTHLYQSPWYPGVGDAIIDSCTQVNEPCRCSRQSNRPAQSASGTRVAKSPSGGQIQQNGYSGGSRPGSAMMNNSTTSVHSHHSVHNTTSEQNGV